MLDWREREHEDVDLAAINHQPSINALKVLSLRTIVHVYKVVHKFHIKVLSLVNRFIGVCQFEI